MTPVKYPLMFSVSILVHLVAGAVLGVVLSTSGDLQVLPVFQQGDVSVEIISSPAVEPAPVTPELVEPIPETPEVIEPPAPVDEIDPMIEPEPEEAQVTDKPAAEVTVSSEGVQGALVPLSEILPRYPLGSRLRGEEGVVMIRASIGVDGRAVTVNVTSSSGFPSLDKAAVKAVMAVRFQRPATPDVIETDLPAFRFRLVE